MGGPRAARLALAALLLTASAACRASSAEKFSGPPATVATEPAPTTTTNPYAVPQVIDAAYVNRVLAALDAALGEVTRLVVRTKTIPPEALDRLKALYADPGFLQIAIDGFQADIRDEFRNYKPIPGNRTTSVTDLLAARADCIFAKVIRDYSAVGTQPSESLNVQWIAIRPLDKARDPNSFNPTTWALVYDGFPPNHAQPKNPCGS